MRRTRTRFTPQTPQADGRNNSDEQFPGCLCEARAVISFLVGNGGRNVTACLALLFVSLHLLRLLLGGTDNGKALQVVQSVLACTVSPGALTCAETHCHLTGEGTSSQGPRAWAEDTQPVRGHRTQRPLEGSEKTGQFRSFIREMLPI